MSQSGSQHHEKASGGLISLFKLIEGRYRIQFKAKRKWPSLQPSFYAHKTKSAPNIIGASVNEWDIKGFIDLMRWRCDLGFWWVCSQLSDSAKTIMRLYGMMVQVMRCFLSAGGSNLAGGKELQPRQREEKKSQLNWKTINHVLNIPCGGIRRW